MAAACHDRIIVYPPAAVPAAAPPGAAPGGHDAPPAPPALAADVPAAPAAPPELDQAEMHFRLGQYPQAVRAYEAFLEGNPQYGSRDRVLFRIALSRALAPGRDTGLSGARAALERLTEEFPGSGYGTDAELILGLISDLRRLGRDIRTRNSRIDRLEEELKRLKEIDLQRRPSRPPEPSNGADDPAPR